jgi:hypothetical protein
MNRSHFARSQRMAILLGIACLISVIVILQLWLFTATMDAYLAGDQAIVVPAALCHTQWSIRQSHSRAISPSW